MDREKEVILPYSNAVYCHVIIFWERIHKTLWITESEVSLYRGMVAVVFFVVTLALCRKLTCTIYCIWFGCTVVFYGLEDGGYSWRSRLVSRRHGYEENSAFNYLSFFDSDLYRPSTRASHVRYPLTLFFHPSSFCSLSTSALSAYPPADIPPTPDTTTTPPLFILSMPFWIVFSI